MPKENNLTQTLQTRFAEIGLGEKADREAFLLTWSQGAKGSVADLTEDEKQAILDLLATTHPPKALAKIATSQKQMRTLRSALIARAQDAEILPLIPYGQQFDYDSWNSFQKWLKTYGTAKKPFAALTGPELRQTIAQLEGVIRNDAAQRSRHNRLASPAQDVTPNPNDHENDRTN